MKFTNLLSFRMMNVRARRWVFTFLLFICSIAELSAQPGPTWQTWARNGEAALEAGDFTRAIADFEQARRLAPENVEIERGLLLSYLQAGRPREAVQLGRDSVARWPQDAQLHHFLGLGLFKTQQNSLALTELQKAATLDATNPDIAFDLALVELEENQYAPAANSLETAIQLKPRNALAHVLLGRAYQNTNRTVQAIEQFQTALKINPDIPLGHYHLGFAYASLGRNQEAIAEYEKEITRSPRNPTVLYQLGRLLLEAGDWQSSARFLERVTEIDPQNADAFCDRGKALLLAGDPASAIPLLQRSIALQPADPRPHYQLARALEKIGKRDDAQREWQLFAELKKAQPQSGGMASGQIR